MLRASADIFFLPFLSACNECIYTLTLVHSFLLLSARRQGSPERSEGVLPSYSQKMALTYSLNDSKEQWSLFQTYVTYESPMRREDFERNAKSEFQKGRVSHVPLCRVRWRAAYYSSKKIVLFPHKPRHCDLWTPKRPETLLIPVGLGYENGKVRSEHMDPGIDMCGKTLQPGWDAFLVSPVYLYCIFR